MHRYAYILLLLLFALPAASRAAEQGRLLRVTDLLDAVISNHPEIKDMTARAEVLRAREISANQMPNPELDSRVLGVVTGGGMSGEYSIRHQLETGGKREARKSHAGTISAAFELSMEIRKQDIARKVLLDLYRMRQRSVEIEVLKESAATYNRMVSLYSRMPRLNPELEISRDIYQKAGGDALLRVAQLEAELAGLEESVLSAAGRSTADLSGLYPGPTQQWPELEAFNISESPILLLAEREIEIGLSEKQIADSYVWPDLSIGPSVGHNSADGKTDFSAGLSLSIELPLFNQNQGQRAEAEAGVRQARIKQETLMMTLKLSRESSVSRYSSLTKSTRALPFPYSARSGHKRLHQLMQRGLIPPSLAIESHRQEFELLRSFHENELSALDALWSIRHIDGTVLKEIRNEYSK